MVYLNKDNLIDVIKIINSGQVVALPTDTIYGLVCQVNNEAAINEIYKIKKRSMGKPLPILVSSWEQAKTIGEFDNELINYLNTFKKGQVTAVVKKQPTFNKINYWEKWGDVAIRVSESELVKNIIAHTGPIVATSCNLSGQPVINNSKDINLPYLKYIVDGQIIDGRPSIIYDGVKKKIIRS